MCWFLLLPSFSPDDLAVQPELELLMGRLRGEHSLLTRRAPDPPEVCADLGNAL